MNGKRDFLKKISAQGQVRESEERQGIAKESKGEGGNARKTIQKKVPENMQRSEARESKRERGNTRRSQGNPGKAR